MRLRSAVPSNARVHWVTPQRDDPVPRRARSIRVKRPQNLGLRYAVGGSKETTSPVAKAASARSKVATRPPFRRARPSRYRSVTCFAVTAARTSGSTTGETASGHQTYSRLAAVSRSSRSAVASGSQGPPGSCAQTRITPSSVTAHVAQPSITASRANQS
jgi:hypothetical protein